MQKYLPFIMYYEVCCSRKVNCLQTCEHMITLWAIKVYMFMKFPIHTRVFEALRETFNSIIISCGCMLLFTNMSLSCKHSSEVVST